MTKLRVIFAATLTLCVSSCVNPNQPNAGYFALDASQAEANRRNTHRIESSSQDFRHDERMSEASAIERATRNRPRSVQNTNVIIVP